MLWKKLLSAPALGSATRSTENSINKVPWRARCTNILLQHSNRKCPKHGVEIVLQAKRYRPVNLHKGGHVPRHVLTDHQVVPSPPHNLQP